MNEKYVDNSGADEYEVGFRGQAIWPNRDTVWHDKATVWLDQEALAVGSSCRKGQGGLWPVDLPGEIALVASKMAGKPAYNSSWRNGSPKLYYVLQSAKIRYIFNGLENKAL